MIPRERPEPFESDSSAHTPIPKAPPADPGRNRYIDVPKPKKEPGTSGGESLRRRPVAPKPDKTVIDSTAPALTFKGLWSWLKSLFRTPAEIAVLVDVLYLFDSGYYPVKREIIDRPLPEPEYPLPHPPPPPYPPGDCHIYRKVMLVDDMEFVIESIGEHGTKWLHIFVDDREVFESAISGDNLRRFNDGRWRHDLHDAANEVKAYLLKQAQKDRQERFRPLE